MEVTIKPVQNESEKMKFIKSQWLFYKDDPLWVPPLLADRKKTLDTVKNPFYNHSELQLFLAYSGSEIVGRIAAITNYNHNKTHNDKIGFFGFFECVDDQEVANKLFDAASDWLKKKNMNVIRGPENPSMNDEIGLLIEGFDSSPIIMMTYNPKYYITLIENAGFSKAKDVLAYRLDKEDFASEKLKRLQDVVRQRYDIKIRTVKMKDKAQLKKDINVMKEIYNAAWIPNWGFVKWTDEEFDFIANDLSQVADENLCIIAESHGKIAGFGLALPDINQCLIHNRGGSLLGALWQLTTKKKKITQLRIIALGVFPEFQKIGVDAVMYYEIGMRGIARGITMGEASWVLEDNMMMTRSLTQVVNGKVYKKYRLYDKNI